MSVSTSSVSTWDSENKHVQSSIEQNGVSTQASTILIAAGAPRLQDARNRPGILGTVGNIVNPSYSANFNSLGDVAYPIGLIENVGIGQNKQLQQFFEIGSELSYFIPGRTVNSMTMNRAYLNGPSLLKVLYAYYKSPEDDDPDAFSLPLDSNNNQPTLDTNNQPGFNNLWLNVASKLFDYPIGILMYFKDNRGVEAGAQYLEKCHIVSHNFGISSSSTLFSESITLRFDRVKPINLKVG